MATYVLGASALYPEVFYTSALIYSHKFLVGIPVLFIGGVCCAALVHGRRQPVRYALDLVQGRWRGCLLVLLFFFASLTAFSTYKIAIPSVVPYYADNWLADADEWLHGMPPWEIVHKLDGNNWSFVVFNSYEVIWFYQWFGTILFVSLWSDEIARIRYLCAAALTLSALGTVLALALASVGPVYYHHFVGVDRFHGLNAALDRLDHSYMVRKPAAYLLMAYQSGRPSLGGGISAMPSMHVAFAALNAYLLSSINRWLGVLGWTFAALILYGSVFTGWHYAVDGYASIVVVSVIWWATGRLVRE
ncbi:phosphatase PAP2 family protein [Mesorhizobium sp. M0184]|uniref:phosphatase PAP2 family protein n=1 Tax=Mesorhizobium sp. M0184 TaxID=2956906 RepID=UPI0033388A4C